MSNDYSQRARSTMHFPDPNFKLSKPTIPQWKGSGSQSNYNLIYTAPINTISNAIGVNTQVQKNTIHLPNGTTREIHSVNDGRIQYNSKGGDAEWLEQTGLHRANQMAAAQFILKQYM